VNLAMLPIIIIAFRYGIKGGVLTGLLYGVVDFLISPYFIHPIQVLLDYPVAFMMVGFAGLVKPYFASGKWSRLSLVVLGALIGSTLRLASHFFSALVWFGQYAPEGMPVWIYAILYNVSYLLPCFLLVSAVLVLLVVGAPKLLQPKFRQNVKV